MTERTPTPAPRGKLAATASKSGSSASTTWPVPCRRTIRGGPAKAHSMITIRPFSRRCAMVSTPLPVWSRKATVRSSRTANSSRLPLGEQFTEPCGSSGAVDTKNTGWSDIHADSVSTTPLYVLATHALSHLVSAVSLLAMRRFPPCSVVTVMTLDAKILTVSESASVGTREDRSGDELARVLVEHGFHIVDHRVVPDGMVPVSAA